MPAPTAAWPTATPESQCLGPTRVELAVAPVAAADALAELWESVFAPVRGMWIRDAVGLVRGGGASAVVTNPIQKKALNDSGFPFPGHTEFLGALAGELFGTTATPVMV